GEYDDAQRNDDGSLTERGAVRDALSATRLAEWTASMDASVRNALARLAPGGTIELLEDFARPWAMDVAMSVMRIHPADRERLVALGDRVFIGTAAPRESPQRADANAAIAELTTYFAGSRMPMPQPT